MKRAFGIFCSQPSVYYVFCIAHLCFERVNHLRACAERFAISAIVDYFA